VISAILYNEKQLKVEIADLGWCRNITAGVYLSVFVAVSCGLLVMLITLDEMRRVYVDNRPGMMEAGYSRDSNAFFISSALLKRPTLISVIMPVVLIRKVVGTLVTW